MTVFRDTATHFNNTFGSNITHVADAYSVNRDKWIMLCFHTEEWNLTKIKAFVNHLYSV